MPREIRTLSIHADYACRHTGACCTSGWHVPVEPSCERRLRSAYGDDRLALLLDRSGTLPPGAVAMTRVDPTGACTFYARGRGAGEGRCRIQQQHGHAALPESCRHFPRVCLLDARGVSVTFSHYCPTAAAQLFRADVPIGIVQSPRSCPASEDWQGLDAREALPPLLRPGLLMDLESYAAWEAHAVAELASPGLPEDALDRLGAQVERLRTWTPGGGPLRDAVAAAARDSRGARDRRDGDHASAARPGLAGLLQWDALVRSAVPGDLPCAAPPAGSLAAADATFVAPAWARHAAPLRAYLATRLFGTWIAYNGPGLRTVIASLRAALAVVRIEAVRQCATRQRALDVALLRDAIRQADLLLVHLADSAVLATRLGRVEASLPASRPAG